MRAGGVGAVQRGCLPGNPSRGATGQRPGHLITTRGAPGIKWVVAWEAAAQPPRCPGGPQQRATSSMSAVLRDTPFRRVGRCGVGRLSRGQSPWDTEGIWSRRVTWPVPFFGRHMLRAWSRTHQWGDGPQEGLPSAGPAAPRATVPEGGSQACP